MPAEFDRLVNLAFYVPIVIVMVLETLAPRRKPSRPTGQRWLHIAVLWIIDTYVARAALAASALVAAIEAGQIEWGLLHAVPLPGPVNFVLGFLLIDLTGYLKHRAYHALPILWQLHVVHHSDVDMDVATGLRHHPGDYVIDGVIAIGVVFLLGISVESVLAFQFFTLIHNALRHGNLDLPRWLDAALRTVIVTPDVHRIHHSADEHETNSNFGVILTCWDRWFGTYRAQPEKGHGAMDLGLEYFRDPSENRLPSMLTQPLRQRRARAAVLGARPGDIAVPDLTPSAAGLDR